MLKHVLVVDDSRSARFMLSKMLEKEGLTTDLVDSAEAALAYLADNQPDAIFIDHMMPGMDGLQATDAIKKDPRFAATPVVLFTSKEGDAYVAEVKSHGAHGVLPKPPSSDRIKALLAQLAGTVPAAGAAPAPASAVAAVARQAVDAALEAHFNERVVALLDARIAALRNELEPADPAAAAIEGAIDGAAPAADGEAPLAELRAALARTEAAVAAFEPRVAQLEGRAAEPPPPDTGRVEALEQSAAVFDERIAALQAGRETLDARLAQIVEQLVEKTARKHAQAIAAVVRKDARQIAEELGAKHAATLRDELVQANRSAPTARVGSGHVAWPPLMVGGIALAVAVVALLVALL